MDDRETRQAAAVDELLPGRFCFLNKYWYIAHVVTFCAMYFGLGYLSVLAVERASGFGSYKSTHAFLAFLFPFVYIPWSFFAKSKFSP